MTHPSVYLKVADYVTKRKNNLNNWLRLLRPNSKVKKIVVGSAGIGQKGYLATDLPEHNILRDSDWKKYAKPGSLENILAEHVFEHLTLKEIKIALTLIHKYLKRGGKVRLAMPDKNRLDRKYVAAVKPPVDGHKSYLNFADLKKIVSQQGFKVTPLEYFNTKGELIHKPWDTKDGFVRRSYPFDRQKPFKVNDYYYTSLIIDAVKV